MNHNSVSHKHIHKIHEGTCTNCKEICINIHSLPQLGLMLRQTKTNADVLLCSCVFRHSVHAVVTHTVYTYCRAANTDPCRCRCSHTHTHRYTYAPTQTHRYSVCLVVLPVVFPCGQKNITRAPPFARS